MTEMQIHDAERGAKRSVVLHLSISEPKSIVKNMSPLKGTYCVVRLKVEIIVLTDVELESAILVTGVLRKEGK